MTQERQTAAVVVLTTGSRPAELERALASVRSQTYADVSLVVVANGTTMEAPAGVTLVTSEVNAGIPGGRNLGVAATAADVIFFLDDDATYASDDLVRTVMAAFSADPGLGILSFHRRGGGDSANVVRRDRSVAGRVLLRP